MNLYNIAFNKCQPPTFEEAWAMLVGSRCDYCGKVGQDVEVIDYEDCMGINCVAICPDCLEAEYQDTKEGGEKYG